jgi:hypothetical protein
MEPHPPAGAMLTQAYLIAVVRHAHHDEADAGPRVEPAVDEPQLRRVVGREHGGGRGAEAAGAGIEVYQPLLNHLIRPRQ